MIMAGKPRAQCVIVSEEVWAAARVDYEDGMTGTAVVAKYGVGIAGLRGRASREGWNKRNGTRAKAAATVLSPPPAAEPPEEPVIDLAADLSPDSVGRGALARANALLLAGRTAEASAVLETLDKLLPYAEVFGQESPQAELEAQLQHEEALLATMHGYAQNLAAKLLGDGQVGGRDAGFAFRWRAENLGADAAAKDRVYAERMGWAETLYDEEGRLRAY
jgi:hypothetical protein